MRSSELLIGSLELLILIGQRVENEALRQTLRAVASQMHSLASQLQSLASQPSQINLPVSVSTAAKSCVPLFMMLSVEPLLALVQYRIQAIISLKQWSHLIQHVMLQGKVSLSD